MKVGMGVGDEGCDDGEMVGGKGDAGSGMEALEGIPGCEVG